MKEGRIQKAEFRSQESEIADHELRISVRGEKQEVGVRGLDVEVRSQKSRI